jgi:hypothetical protein
MLGKCGQQVALVVDTGRNTTIDHEGLGRQGVTTKKLYQQNLAVTTREP